MPQVTNAAQQESSPCHQDEGKGELYHHKAAEQTMLASCGATRSFVEGALYLGTCALDRRSQAEENPYDDRSQDREEEDGEVNANVCGARQGFRQCRKKQAQAESGEHGAQCSARERKHDAFGQQLSHHASATGTKRRP